LTQRRHFRAHCENERDKEWQMASPEGQYTQLYDTAGLERVLDAMAAALANRLSGVALISLVGVKRRGAPLSDWLLQRLHKLLPAANIERLDLTIKRYADDLTLLYPQTQLTEQPGHAQIDLTDRVVVVVDDVLYQGYSLNKAVQYLLAKGSKSILTVVLVDRVCATLPIHADVVGLKLQAAPGQIVECHVPPFEPTFQIVLVQPAQS
jgi:pyrimidine operon attenuation protein/uracil phosphoribosyltransferase